MNFGGSSSSSGQYSIDPAASARMAAVQERQVAMGEEQWRLGRELFEPYERQMIEANRGLIGPNAELVKAQFESQKGLMPEREAAERGALQTAQQLYEKAGTPIDPEQRAGQAQADVTQAYTQGAGNMRRDLSRMGVAPGSERMTSAMSDMAMDRARAIGGARTGARRNAEQEELSRLGLALQARPGNLPYQTGQVQMGNYGLQNPMNRAMGFYGNAIQANAAGMRPLSFGRGSSFSGGFLSSIRSMKEDIRDLTGIEFDKLYHLKPVSFRFKEDVQPRRMGFIAEDVEPHANELVARDEYGIMQGLYYQDIIPLLVGEVQRLNKRIKALEGK